MSDIKISEQSKNGEFFEDFDTDDLENDILKSVKEIIKEEISSYSFKIGQNFLAEFFTNLNLMCRLSILDCDEEKDDNIHIYLYEKNSPGINLLSVNLNEVLQDFLDDEDELFESDFFIIKTLRNYVDKLEEKVKIREVENDND